MLFKKTLSAVALAVFAFATTVASGPLPPFLSGFVMQAVSDRYNNFACKPSSSKPNPIILLHGLLGNSGEFSIMGPRFALEGYCTYTLDYGHVPGYPFGGLNDLKASAQELSKFVDDVLVATGASKVDIVGHSEGSTLPRVYLKYNKGTDKVDHFAAIGSNQYGTTLASIATLWKAAGLYKTTEDTMSSVCKACFQLTEGAPFLADLNNGGDTYPQVKYLMLVSR